MSLNLIFAGTPEFAAPSLSALIHSSHTVRAVYTQPDRPAGRGRQLQASPVKQLAQTEGIPVYQPMSFQETDALITLREHQADLMIVVAYGLLLPESVLSLFPLGCINVHASLLPRWRGAAPIQRAILAGDDTTGITIMQMEKGLDTGAMLCKASCSIDPHETAAQLHDRLATLGATTLVDALQALQTGSITPEIQNSAQATYAKKLTKQEALIDWQQSAEHIARSVRGYNAWPVAYTLLDQKTIRIWEASSLSQTSTASPGTVIAATATGIDVATANGVLRIHRLQFPGGKPLPCGDILNASRNTFTPGVQFSSTC